MRTSQLCYLASLFLMGACGSHSDLSLDLTKLNSIEPNDSQVNGFSVNGLTVNGLTVNGLTVNGLTVNSSAASISSTIHRTNDLANVRFDSAALHGHQPAQVWLTQSTLEANDGQSSLSGAQLVGTTFAGKLLDGMNIPLRIEDVQVSNGVTLYSVSILTDAGPIPLCATSNGSPIPSIALAGFWDKSATHVDDASAFTFGCVNAAIGKCVLWGYRPWEQTTECRNNSCKTRNLIDWHRACVRLVRADYCGDGIAHTRSGTHINVYDQLGIQQSSNPGWAIESEWRQDGAACINHTRWLQADSNWTENDLAYVQSVCPDRLATAKGSRCDESKSTYNTQFGFNKSSDDRPLIRNESPQYE